MSANKPAIDDRKHNPYEQPVIKRLTLEEAKKLLKSQPQGADENLEKVLKEISRLEGE